MKQNPEMKRRKNSGKSWLLLAAGLAFCTILLIIFPDRQAAVIKSSRQIFIEMFWILPAVMLLIGLFTVWAPKEKIVKLMGKASGIRGIGLSLLLGSLPTGPLYVAFPLAAALIKKGARVSNIIIFLSAWACIKIPQEMVELQFLGVGFMLLRLSLMIIFVIIMGVFIEQAIESKAASKVEK